jgi:hypothetical protein
MLHHLLLTVASPTILLFRHIRRSGTTARCRCLRGQMALSRRTRAVRMNRTKVSMHMTLIESELLQSSAESSLPRLGLAAYMCVSNTRSYFFFRRFTSQSWYHKAINPSIFSRFPNMGDIMFRPSWPVQPAQLTAYAPAAALSRSHFQSPYSILQLA